MPYANCPDCRLSIAVRGERLAPRHCPRCIGRRRALVPMFSSPLPYRLLAATDADPGEAVTPH